MSAATIASGIKFNHGVQFRFKQNDTNNKDRMMYKMESTTTTAGSLTSNQNTIIGFENSLPKLSPQSTLSTKRDDGDYLNTQNGVVQRQHTFTRRHKLEYSRLSRRNEIHIRKQKISDLTLLFAIIGLCLMVLETELTMSQIYSKEDIQSCALKFIITGTTCCLLVLVTNYHSSEMELFMVNNGVNDIWVTLTSDRIIRYLAEIIICSMHPIPYSHLIFGGYGLYTNFSPGTRATYVVKCDLILGIPMFCRLLLISRVMLLHSRMVTDISSRSIGAMNHINFNSKFVVKGLMTICPGTVIVTFVITLFMIASWTVRIFELLNDPTRHSTMLNSMWLIAVTFLAVGYGDIVPHTYCGRAVCVASAMMGVTCTATMVAILTRKLELTRAEKHVHNFMMESKINKRLRESAAVVLQETWRIYRLTKMSKDVDGRAIRKHQRNFLKAVYRLRGLKYQQSELSDNINLSSDFSKAIFSLNDSMHHLKAQQKHLQLELETVSSRLTDMQNQLTKLPIEIIKAIYVSDPITNKHTSFNPSGENNKKSQYKHNENERHQ